MKQIEIILGPYYRYIKCSGCKARARLQTSTLVEVEHELRWEYGWRLEEGEWQCKDCQEKMAATDIERYS
jgi:hypothetical protein